ncbi:Carboxylic acid transporter [Vanrija pseudolonga]|uniref:Carboxylic acid transporter n=1 Tax=Vanrija pseudolonga TaxID=143232 RepID=A0AAF1BP63_9TREE|nr:Carboxylic acid transporter [Vanrija pseudolonga]
MTQYDAGDEEHAIVHKYPPTSFRGQLEGWHADRGDKTFFQAAIPSWRKTNTSDDEVIYNPIKLLGLLGWMDWLYFFSGWWAWTCDGFDYFAVSVTLAPLEKQFNRGDHALTTAITLTLLFRSLGAILFGLLADRFGRKWTLVVNLLLIAVFELASGFVNTFQEFLGVRAIFGIVMGGIWGQAAATALENVPVQARGLISGILQQGYAVGYLLAAVINLTVVQNSKYGWRSIYFIGAGFSLSAAIIRACLPESRQYILAREQLKAEGLNQGATAKRFFKEIGNMFKTNWVRCIWGVLVMTGFNFFSHGSQDLYPKYLQTTKFLTAKQASRATIISNCGAVAGGTIAGYLSQYAGRRLTAMVFIIITACFIPLWILPTKFGGLAAGGFWVQFGVQGAWGIVPIYLGEVSPPAFRASFAGVAYQLGNMVSSGAAQIEATAGNSLRIADPTKKNCTGSWVACSIPDYAKIQGILIGIVAAWLLFWLFLGPEADGAHFEQAKTAFQEGGGLAEAPDFVAPQPGHEGKHQADHIEDSKDRDVEKGQTIH